MGSEVSDFARHVCFFCVCVVFLCIETSRESCAIISEMQVITAEAHSFIIKLFYSGLSGFCETSSVPIKKKTKQKNNVLQERCLFFFKHFTVLCLAFITKYLYNRSKYTKITIELNDEVKITKIYLKKKRRRKSNKPTRYVTAI